MESTHVWSMDYLHADEMAEASYRRHIHLWESQRL